MILPSAAEYWGNIAYEFIYRNAIDASVPSKDTRWMAGYRVNPKGDVDVQGSIQVISITGPIAKYDFCYNPGSQSLQQAVRAANADDTVSGILLVIDSPGGQVDGTENLATEIKNSQKPVIAFVDGLCCSAAYWIGSSAAEIIVDGANNGFNATIGSIGTMCAWKDTSKQEEMQGVKTHVVYADESVDKNKMMEADEEGNFPAIKEQLNNLNGTFLTAVKNNRHGKLSTKENVLTGKTYNGKEAIKHGLADRIGNFQTAVSRTYFLSKNNLKK